MSEQQNPAPATEPRMFPILGSKVHKSIPWSLLEPFRAQAAAVHSQTLEQLARRGGLAPIEVWGIVNGVNVFGISDLALPKNCDAWLQQYVSMQTELVHLRAEHQAWRDRYMREVEGLNSEGDPIGGDPPSGLRHQVEHLRAEVQRLTREECARPDIIERLSYHAHERDDMTLDECLDMLATGWERVHGRTERELVMQILALLAGAPAAQADDPVDLFLSEVRAELVRARTKFPGDRIMTIALAEEFGELCKAVLDESAAAVRKEAVQTAAMAARVVLDGDGSVREWRQQRGLDALAGATA